MSLRTIVVISCFLSTLFITIIGVPITKTDPHGQTQVAPPSLATSTSPLLQTIAPQDIQLPTLSECNGSVKRLISAFVKFFHDKLSTIYEDGPDSHAIQKLVMDKIGNNAVDDYDSWITRN
ncbi:hypothetical protein H0H93_002450, partial [Arthromyces matolae]